MKCDLNCTQLWLSYPINSLLNKYCCMNVTMWPLQYVLIYTLIWWCRKFWIMQFKRKYEISMSKYYSPRCNWNNMYTLHHHCGWGHYNFLHLYVTPTRRIYGSVCLSVFFGQSTACKDYSIFMEFCTGSWFGIRTIPI